MGSLERYLVGLETPPWNAIWRFALGLSLPPLFSLMAGTRPPAWAELALFVAVLIALYLVPAALRRLLPFSAEARAIWSARRDVARWHDSYQWRKLFWIGLGLSPYALIGGLDRGEWLIALVCLIGGGAGLLLWSRMQPIPDAGG